MVIGEAMLDTYIRGTVERICRESPVPVVEVDERENVPGGAANTALNVRCLGGHVQFLSVIGSDPDGLALRRCLVQKGVRTEGMLVQKDRQTLAKKRVVADSQMIVRFDQGSVEPIDRKTEKSLIQKIESEYPLYHAVIISDYGYGIITPAVIDAVARLHVQDPKLLLVDAKDLNRYRGLRLTVVKPNFPEALTLLGLPKNTDAPSRIETIAERGHSILDITGAQIAAVTLDADGALIFERDRPVYRTFAKSGLFPKPVGAGDTFISAFALALTCNADTPTAAEIASAASSVVVEKTGTAPCYWAELKESFYGDDKVIHDAFYLAARVTAYRRNGKKIVFTNGCFDILHRGHISYLNLAKREGDILIVGLNSDKSVRSLKGSNRPVNSIDDRSQILAALSSVDHIVPFDAKTPIDLIRIIKPDVFVKGGDYTRETLPEADLVEELGGTVRILPYLEDRSTTGMIERINRIYEREHLDKNGS